MLRYCIDWARSGSSSPHSSQWRGAVVARVTPGCAPGRFRSAGSGCAHPGERSSTDVRKERLEAFSDGVFAIAITLLVLEIKVPDPGPGGLAHQLAEQWPSYAAYVVSFMTIGIIWINHHAVMANLIFADRTLLLINLVLLGWVSLIPWPTQLTAEYMRTGGADERTASLVYAGVMAAMGLTFGWLWRHATAGRRLVVDELTDDSIRRSNVRFRIGGPVYLVAMAIALVSATLSLAVVGVLAIYYVLPAGGAIPHPAEQ
jgi:uncharacterized membrane protein